jgi:hypothetical protein
MRLFCKLTILLICLAVGASSLAAKEKKGTGGGKNGKPSTDADATPSADEGGGGRLNLPLLKDHPAKGLKAPYYDKDGRLEMMFTVGDAVKTDNDHVSMKGAQVETYNEEEEIEMTVQLPESVLNLSTRVISSNTRATIKREDFTLVGDGLEFNTLTKLGALTGNVHMTIYNAKAQRPDDAAMAGVPKPPRGSDLKPADPISVPTPPVIALPTSRRK